MKIALAFLISTLSVVLSQDYDITLHLNWLRHNHGANKVEKDDGMVYNAYEATNAMCQYGGIGHWRGTEAESASLYVNYAPCKGAEQDLVDALNTWYDECWQYSQGQEFSDDTGHFTQMVWKSAKRYGMWAQTCTGSSGQFCAVALKTDTFNVQGAYNQNVQAGNCNKTPWARFLSLISTYSPYPTSPVIANPIFVKKSPFKVPHVPIRLGSPLTYGVPRFPISVPKVPKMPYFLPKTAVARGDCYNNLGQIVPCNN